MLPLSRTYSGEGKESEDRQIMDFLRYSNVRFNPDGSMYYLISRARDLYFQGSPYVTESLDFSLLVCHHKIRAQHGARSYLVVLDRLGYDGCTLVGNFVPRQIQTRASLLYQCLVHHTLHVGIE